MTWKNPKTPIEKDIHEYITHEIRSQKYGKHKKKIMDALPDEGKFSSVGIITVNDFPEFFRKAAYG